MQTTFGNKIHVQNFTKNNIPKSVISFFISVQILTGINVGFSQALGGKIRTYLNRYALCLSVAISGILLSTIRLSGQDISWFWGCTTKFILYSIAFRLMNYSIYNFVKELHDFREKIPLLDKGHCGFGVMFYACSSIFGRYIFALFRCHVNKHKYCEDMTETYHFFFSYAIQSSDIVGSFLILIMYYVYAFVVYMKSTLQSNFDVISFEQRYVFLSNSYDKVKLIYNYIIITELFVNTPRLMVTLWYMLKYIKESAEWFAYTSEWVFAFHLTIQMCIPAVIAEIVNCQLDSIKQILNELGRVEKDQAKSYEITRVLRYIKGRNLQNDIWRVIPVDLRLPLAMFSVCTTYLIVILQFTHLYD